MERRPTRPMQAVTRSFSAARIAPSSEFTMK